MLSTTFSARANAITKARGPPISQATKADWSASVAWIERQRNLGSVFDALDHSRISLRSIRLHASPSPAGGGSTAEARGASVGGRGGVRGVAARPSALWRCHPTRRASRDDLPLQGRLGDPSL